MRSPGRCVLAALLLYAGHACATLPFRPEAEASESFSPWTIAVLAVLLAVAAVLLVLKKKGVLRAGMTTRSARRRMRVCEVLPLGAGARLIEVEHDGRKLLLGVTPGQVSLLEARNSSTEEQA